MSARAGLLAGRVALVSGIGPGLGRAVALALAQHGADVALAARSAGFLATVAGEVEALGRRALTLPGDVTDADSCRRLVAGTESELGGLDVLVNNAYHAGTYLPFEEDDLAHWRPPLEVNLLGSLRLTQAAVPALRRRGGGAVVMVGSMIVREVLPTMAGYAASKAALLAASRGLARELGPHGIRVNTVLPGYIWGPALKQYFSDQAGARGVAPGALYDEVAARIALGHIPEPDEIAGAVVFLASELACAVTGQSLDVNGGHVMR